MQLAIQVGNRFTTENANRHFKKQKLEQKP